MKMEIISKELWEKIELYYTTLMTVDSRQIVIPNSTLTGNSITNVTAMDKRRLEIKVGICPGSDIFESKGYFCEDWWKKSGTSGTGGNSDFCRSAGRQRGDSWNSGMGSDG